MVIAAGLLTEDEFLVNGISRLWNAFVTASFRHILDVFCEARLSVRF